MVLARRGARKAFEGGISEACQDGCLQDRIGKAPATNHILKLDVGGALSDAHSTRKCRHGDLKSDNVYHIHPHRLGGPSKE